MAALFWVGGTGTFDGSTNHFATSTGGSATVAAVTSSDDVTIDSASGSGTMTIGAAFSCNSLTVNSSTLTVACDGSHGITAVGAMTLSLGTLNTNGQTCSWGSFNSNFSTTRTITFGASAITITGTASNTFVTGATGLTWTANTATITFTGASSATLLSCGSQNLNGASLVFSGAGSINLSFGTCANFTRTGTAAKTDGIQFGRSVTMTGTLTLNGNSTVNRLLVSSNTAPTAITLTAAVVSVSNADFVNITGAGAGSWDLSAATGGSGDCQGNTGITFTTAVPQAWQTTSSGSWSNAANWTSRVPLPQDDVTVSKAFSASQTITQDMARMGKSIDFTGSTGTPTLQSGGGFCGNLTLISGMTLTVGGIAWNALGQGAQTITSAGKHLTNSISITGSNGTYTLQDDLFTTSTLTFQNGSFNANNFNVTTSNVVNTSTSTRTITMGSGTWTLTGTSGVFNSATGLTINAGTSTIVISDTSATSKTFAGASYTYNILRHTATGSAGLTISGSANVFAQLDLECSTARTITFGAGGVTTVGVLTLQGASGQTLSLVSGTPGTSATINVTRAYTKNFDSESADIILNLPIMGGGGGTGPGLRLVRKGF